MPEILNRVFEFKMPGSLIMGNGAIAGIGDAVKKVGEKKVLLVTDKGLARSGILEKSERDSTRSRFGCWSFR